MKKILFIICWILYVFANFFGGIMFFLLSISKGMFKKPLTINKAFENLIFILFLPVYAYSWIYYFLSTIIIEEISKNFKLQEDLSRNLNLGQFNR